LTSIAIGCLFYTINSQIIPSNHVSYFIGYKGIFSGSIINYPQVSNGKTEFILGIEYIRSREVSGKVKITLPWEDTRFNYGDRVEIIGRIHKPYSLRNPCVFNYQKYLSYQKIFAACTVHRGTQIKKIGKGRRNPIIELSSKIRDKIVKIIYYILPEPHASFLDGVILGNRTHLPKEIQRWFEDTGTLHILAVSGMNVMLVVITFLFFFQTIGINKRLAYLLNIPIVIIFCLVTGWQPSVVRASIMTIIFLISKYIFERDVDVFHVLGLSALICLIPYPHLIFDISFQLSFSAVWGILYFTPFIQKWLWFLPKWLGIIIATTSGAQLATIPLLAYYFHKVSLVSLIANIVVVPLVGLITPIGLITFGVSWISLYLGWLITCVNYVFISLLLIFVEYCAQMPYTCLNVSTPSLVEICIYYILLISIRNIQNIGWKNVILICLISVNLILWKHIVCIYTSTINAIVFEVTRGRIIYFQFKDKKDMLIALSVKPQDIKWAVLPFLKAKGTNEIKIVILNQPKIENILKEDNIDLNLVVKDILYTTGKITGCDDISISLNSNIIYVSYRDVIFLFPISKVINNYPSDLDKNKFIILCVDNLSDCNKLSFKSDVIITTKDLTGYNYYEISRKVYCTQKTGAIIISTNGYKVKIKRYI
jgi:ComEC/Rec2-related protein